MCHQGLLTKPCPRQGRDLDRRTPRPTVSRSTFGRRGAQTQQAEPQLRATPSTGHRRVRKGFLTEGAEVPKGSRWGRGRRVRHPGRRHTLCAWEPGVCRGRRLGRGGATLGSLHRALQEPVPSMVPSWVWVWLGPTLPRGCQKKCKPARVQVSQGQTLVPRPGSGHPTQPKFLRNLTAL